jgi:hypothetical protein
MEKRKLGQKFRAERLHGYVKKFSFPRLAGSPGEKKAVQLTSDLFNQLGFSQEQIESESFRSSDFYSTTLIKLIAMINLVFLLMFVFFTYLQFIISILVIIGLVIIILFILRGLRSPEHPGFWGKYYGKMFNATNVFVKIPSKNMSEERAGDIIISAHLDSKSQSFQTQWRVIFYRIWLFSAIFLGITFALYIATLIGPFSLPSLFFQIGLWVPTILISITNIFLMNLNTHNKSDGALDNASGMAVVFELSSYFQNHPLNNFNLWFCQYSAEELGTMGSRVFVDNHEVQFEKGRIFQINLDMISCKGHRWNRVEYLKSYGVFPRRKIAPLLAEYLETAASKEDIEIYGFHLTTGAHTDSVPYHQRNFASIDLVTRAASKYSHTKNDTPDKVDGEVLKDACILIRRVVLNLDQNYQELCGNNILECD